MSDYESSGLKLRHSPAAYECPFCLQPVGLIGRFFAWLFGTRFHGCDFSNVRHPADQPMEDA